MKIVFYESEEIFQNPSILQRLRFLTNGGWGRHWVGSGMLSDLGTKQKGWMFLAWEEKEIIGWAYLTSSWDSKCLNVGTYVQRKWRRKGVGSKLIAKAKEFAKKKKKRLSAEGWNIAGSKFYRKHKIRR